MKIIKRRVALLKPHPYQQEVFADLPDADLEALAADMAARGLQHPVEIVCGNTIVTGHQRVRAAKRLGWKTIDAVIRTDLTACGESAIRAHLIADNLNRRELRALAKARCVVRLLEMEIGRPVGKMDWDDKERVKTAVAKRLGMSVRNMNRYLLALKAPIAMQEAFDRGEMSLIAIGKTVSDPGAVETDPHAAALLRIIRAIRRDLPAVKGRTFPDKLVARSRDALSDAAAVFAEIVRGEL